MSVDALNEQALNVIDGFAVQGDINTTEPQLLANIAHSIRLGHPQVKQQQPQRDRVCLVGGGPSLDDTLDELRDLYFAGAKVVTVNGSLEWCVERNIRPAAHIVLDARAFNARFVARAIPRCRYLIASQCHPDTWAAVQERPEVWIWHANCGDDGPQKDLLDAFYLKQWQPVVGGTTVIMRALLLLRILGFLRFDLFGVDSCWIGGRHHAYQQAENDQDHRLRVTVSPSSTPELSRTFECAPWQLKQLECFLQTIRVNGHELLINVHGDGLLAYVLKAGAQASIVQHAAVEATTSQE